MVYLSDWLFSTVLSLNAKIITNVATVEEYQSSQLTLEKIKDKRLNEAL